MLCSYDELVKDFTHELSARWCHQASSSGKQDELRRALRRMVLAADAHVADLFSCGRGQELEKGQGAAGGCNGILDTADGAEIRQTHQLRER